MKNLVFILLIITGLAGCEQLGKDNKVAKIETIKDKVRTIDSANASKDLLSEPANINQKKPDNKTKAAKMAYNAGVQYYQKGDLDNALMQFKKVLENTPGYSPASHYLGRIYYDKGQKELSLSYYEDAVKNNINDSVSILGIGQVYFDLGNHVQAMEYYNMSIDVAPNYGLAYYNRGTLLGMQNKYIEALDDLNKSIELDPNNGNAYVNRGLAYFYLKQMNSACRDWQKASDMGIEKATEAVEQYCK